MTDRAGMDAACDAMPALGAATAARDLGGQRRLSAVLATGAEALDRFAEFHRQHQWHPESHHDLLRAAIAQGHAALPLHLMVFDGDRACTLVVAQIVDAVVSWRVGYGSLGSSRARVIEVLRGGILGEQSPACLEFACDQLRGAMRSLGVDAISVRHVAAESIVHQVFARRPPWACRDRLAVVTRNWQLTVPKSFAEFTRRQSRRERDDNRRYERRIEREFGAAVRIERVEQIGDVDRVVAVVERIARRTYQRGLGAGFRDSEAERARWRAAAAGGFLHAYVLWLGDEPVAFCSGFRIGGTLWLEHLGYDPAHRRLRPGFFLLLRIVESLADAGCVCAIDFGIGDADYKRRLCDRYRDEASVWVFAPTLRGLWLNGVRGTTNALYGAGHWLLARIGLLDWMRSRWRRALQPKDEESGEA